MDNMPPGHPEKNRNILSNGQSFRRSMPGRPESAASPSSPTQEPRFLHVTVQKDEHGYGMKVSGDNPVFVQSVKEGGAAGRAGLQCGDMIIKVNGANVTHSTHTQVVSLIKASTNVELVVQQQRPIRQPSAAVPAAHAPPLRHTYHNPRSSDRVTSPLPVDMDKQRQLDSERVMHIRLMLEQDVQYVEALRSELAKTRGQGEQEQKIARELEAAERRIIKMQGTLNSSANHEYTYALPQPTSPTNPFHIHTILEGEGVGDTPPPLPNRNTCHSKHGSHRSALPPLPPRPSQVPSTVSDPAWDESDLLDLPASSNQLGHHRTKSNPDPMTSATSGLGDASRRLITAESMQDLYRRSKHGSSDVDSPRESPAGTPPPPYRPLPCDESLAEEEIHLRLHGEDSLDTSHRSSHIMSMEEDDISDQETSHLDDHGPYKSLTKLWEHHAHLAVFMNYVISNSDPSSLLFYLVTDLYKEGNAKEMKRWAYEIHSSFLVPDAPLRLGNIDENLAREIDEVLLNDADKEEILRKVFRKARLKAKEELHELLVCFQQKRVAGLGTLYGPSDAQLEEAIQDKSKELKICETILVPKLEPYIADMERDCKDMRRFTTAAALGTVIGKVFGVGRSAACSALLERCPTFVSKDKSLKSRLLIGKSKRIAVRGHNFVAHQYFTVTHCNHCHQIIWGIGPQGFKCTNCNFDVHRLNCVRQVEESCIGPMTKKERGDNRISKLMEKIQSRGEGRRKPSAINFERGKKHGEDGEEVADNDAAAAALIASTAGDRPVVQRRPDTVRETEEKNQNDESSTVEDRLQGDLAHHAAKKNSPINRSESYRERIPQKKIRERRKTSDPNLSKSNDVELENQALAYHTNSGSSSNSSLSTRSLDSPCGPTEMVTSAPAPPAPYPPSNIPPPLADSDMEADPDPPDWARSAPESVLHNMTGRERKRQDIINELFHTERSHVRNLKVLNQLFLQPMTEMQILHQEQLTLLFQNLEEMLDIHSRWNKMMKQRRLEGDPVVGNVGDLLLKMLEGAEGDEFIRAAAQFCEKQQIALAQLKELRRKDSKLHNFLVEAEGHPLCRRLQLKDMLPLVMQRLTKYRLLFENLVKYSERGSDEEKAIRRAVARSKEVLTQVDLKVNEAQAQHRLEEIMKRLDKSAFEKYDHPISLEFKNFDLRKHKLLHEGSLTWRIPNRPKNIECTVLLLEDCIVFLTKQDDKHILKYHMADRQVFSPIIRVANLLVRVNAADKLALYIVSTITNSMYDVAAPTFNERELWFRHISDAAEGYKNRNGRTGQQPAGVPGHPTPPDAEAADERHRTESHEESSKQDEMDTSGTSQESTDSGRSQQSSPTTPTLTPDHVAEAKGKSVTSSPSMRRPIDPLRLTTVENALINPSEIIVSQKAVLKAEPVLTPLEQLRLKDIDIRRALQEKQHLVADILHVPREEFLTIAEMAGEPGGEKEAAELVLAAICQANQLTEALNETLRVTEEDTVFVTSGASAERSGAEPACSPRNKRRSPRVPALPATRVHTIASSLNSHLTHLLELVKERDEERDRLRRELQKSRNLVNALHESHRKGSNSSICQSCTTARSVPAPSNDTGPSDAAPVDTEGDAAEAVQLVDEPSDVTAPSCSDETVSDRTCQESVEVISEDVVGGNTVGSDAIGDSGDPSSTCATQDDVTTPHAGE